MSKPNVAKIFACTTMAIGCGQSLAEIKFDQLSSCKDVRIVMRELKTSSMPTTDNCRGPRSVLDRALTKRLGETNPVKVCFLPAPPSVALSRFSCMRMDFPRTRHEILCIAPAEKRDIADYRRNYKQLYAAVEQKYQSDAVECPVSSGDVANAASSTSPYVLQLVARFEFASLQRWEVPTPAWGHAIHGYASTDPALAGAPDAIEFVDFIYSTGVAPEDAERTHRVGPWDVGVDEGLAKAWKDGARRSGVPLLLEQFSFRINRPLPVSHTADQKKKLLTVLDERMRRVLIEEDYEAISDAEVKRESGKSYADLIANSREALPYGAREDAKDLMPSSFIGLVNKKTPRCSRGDGAVLALVSSTQAKTSEASNFGSVDVALVGVHACNSTDSAAKKYLSNLKRQLKDELFQIMENEK